MKGWNSYSFKKFMKLTATRLFLVSFISTIQDSITHPLYVNTSSITALEIILWAGRWATYFIPLI